MILASVSVAQPALAYELEQDPLVQRYRSFFALLDWTHVSERTSERRWPGERPHPETAYIKALLVKLCEQKPYITQLRAFLDEHPLLVAELGFQLEQHCSKRYGFDVQASLPCDRWLRHKQQTLDNDVLQALFCQTVHSLQHEIEGLGTTIAVDVKHIYAWVQENNSKAYVQERYNPERQPRGDKQCRLGVKRSSNQEQPDGSKKQRKEYVWGYGTGVVAAITPDYGDVVLAEYTQPFNENDISYYRELYQRSVEALGFRPTNIAADAAFDAWYVYQDASEAGGVAAVPLNTRGRGQPQLGPNGLHCCPKGLEMVRVSEFEHADGYRAQEVGCPLLVPRATGEVCDHEQFAKGVDGARRSSIFLIPTR